MYRKGMPFTQEDIQRARNVNLVGYLESCGIELKRKGQMVCLKEHDNLVIDPANNKWHWNSRNVHGANAVDFLMAYDNRTFLDAISELLGEAAQQRLTGCGGKSSGAEDVYDAASKPEHAPTVRVTPAAGWFTR